MKTRTAALSAQRVAHAEASDACDLNQPRAVLPRDVCMCGEVLRVHACTKTESMYDLYTPRSLREKCASATP